MSENKETVIEVSELLKDYDGGGTVAIYVGEVSSFTDYFVISTARSMTHLSGLHRRVEEHLSRRNVNPLNRHKRSDENGWTLLDFGFMVIHLMTEDMREFYELERLWFNGTVIYRDEDDNGGGARDSSI
ncbi:MAG: ribosome silencing factor [Spirochaetota bacterium]